MNRQVSAVELSARLEAPGSRGSGRVLAATIAPLALRVRGEYGEMPGLRLTVLQAARLFGVAPDVAHGVLDDLRRASVLTYSDGGHTRSVPESAAERRGGKVTNGVNNGSW